MKLIFNQLIDDLMSFVEQSMDQSVFQDIVAFFHPVYRHSNYDNSASSDIHR